MALFTHALVSCSKPAFRNKRSNLITLGVITGVAILALKTGLGCGFANLGRREIVYVALIYFITSIVLGYLVGVIL
ncbi:MAG: hypothetical protein C4B56_01455 [Candidatus Methanophagaceae archaeon]|nr:MAG: hypothetical protein C4B56_01455 [Methanophagales archaeon]